MRLEADRGWGRPPHPPFEGREDDIYTPLTDFSRIRVLDKKGIE